MCILHARSSVAAGLRVKVRRAPPLEGSPAALALGRPGGTLEYTQWRGGSVARVSGGGVFVEVEFDDGAVQTTVFPNASVVVDDAGNGDHRAERWSSIDAFLPGPRSGGYKGPRTARSGSRPGVKLSDGELPSLDEMPGSEVATAGLSEGSRVLVLYRGMSLYRATVHDRRRRLVATPGVDDEDEFLVHYDGNKKTNLTWVRAILIRGLLDDDDKLIQEKPKRRISRATRAELTANSPKKVNTHKRTLGSSGADEGAGPSKKQKSGSPEPPKSISRSKQQAKSVTRPLDDIDLSPGVTLRASGKWQVQVYHKCR